MGKVSVKTLRAACKNTTKDISVTYGIVDDDHAKMMVKTVLDAKEAMNLVNELAIAEWTIDDKTKEDLYTPQGGEIIKAVKIAEYYTDLTLPENIIEAYNIVSRLDIYKKVEEIASANSQWQDIQDAITKAQEYTKSNKTGFNKMLNNFSNLASLKDEMQKLTGQLEQEAATGETADNVIPLAPEVSE